MFLFNLFNVKNVYLYRKQIAAATTMNRSKHTLPQLTYDYKALEPIISGQIMEVSTLQYYLYIRLENIFL